MSTRAKLRCDAVEETNDGTTAPKKTGENVRFSAVTNGSPEDNIYSKWTPFAQFNMSVTNPDVFGQFEVGKAYYFDISPAE